ncbi:MAG: NADH-quinone oxidoreductase subunit C [Betaproteobacteria bacterium]|nr:NADH-quinone oxidoreductase subunit C [Betaproteobacteria bacterium]
MTDNPTLIAALESALADSLVRTEVVRDQVIVTIRGEAWQAAARTLRDSAGLRFDQMIDLCGMDYRTYGDGRWDGLRYAVTVQLLSVQLNHRLRVKIFAPDDELPSVDSVVDVWSGANWFEREAFDLYGIVFPGHPDLRRILTDYGFIGHPFRKDFPVSGFVEMRYDPEQRRVIYQPVSIEAREIVPRVVREDNYGGAGR